MDAASGTLAPAGSAAGASSSGSPAGECPTGRLPERFVALDYCVAQELSDVEYPWDLTAVEDRIKDYSSISEKINAQLSARVMQNYNEFVQGMQQVQTVETELTLIGVLVKNGRRKLQERDLGLVRGSMHVTRQHKKAQRLEGLLATLSEFQDVVRLNTSLSECIRGENYCEAIAQHTALVEALAVEKFRRFPGLLGLREGLGHHLDQVQQKLSDGLRVAAVSSEFDAERYEEILKAYSMMSPDTALSVGKELLRHVSECIVAVSRQCMLMFSCEETQDTPAHKAQLRDLCRNMDPTHFVDCTAKLYEHLCDFLYRHQFLCRWHEYRAQGAEAEEGNERFREVLRDVLSELVASKRNVWHHISQQVSLVLLTLDFQYPALSEESFLRILHLTQTLIDEGDVFMADHAPLRTNSGDMSMQGRRQWSAPIKNTLKAKANDYFQSLHFNAWTNFKVHYIEQDTWQRLPVARSYSLIRKDIMTAGAAVEKADVDAAGSKLRTAESNPFRNWKDGAVGGRGIGAIGSSHEEGAAAGRGAGGIGTHSEGADDDEHALLQHWINDTETLPHEQIGSSMLSNSNRSPVVSLSTVELAHLLERYFRMMGAIPQLALDVFQSAIQLVEFYVHCVLCLFVQDRHLRAFLEDTDAGQQAAQPGDARLGQRHEALLLQKLCPDLRRAIAKSRELMSSLALPNSCASVLNLSAPVKGSVFLQVTPYSKLSAPSSLCGLSERCVGVESVWALLGDLRDMRDWLRDLLPKSEKDAVDRFLTTQEVVASQLRTFVLRCAASDILEVPHVGRVSLDHFSNTMQSLKWDATDFSKGSPGAPYLDQLRAQIDELARRIPCAGGGSIPYATQQIVWGWMEARILQEFADLIAKCGRKKSPEAIVRLAEDFSAIRSSAQQNFRAPGADGAAEPDMQLLPAEHPLGAVKEWTYLDQYLEAHRQMPADLMVWCKQHPEYPFRLHKALIEWHHTSQKVQRQHLNDLEAFVASYITEQAPELAGSRAGL